MNAKNITQLLLVLPALLLGLPAAAGDATRFAIEEDQVMLGFTAQLGAHKQLVATARTLTGAVQLEAGAAQVKLRVPLASIETGSAATDAALRAALSGDKFPEIELEATAPASTGREATLTFAGTLKLGGAQVPVSVPVKLLRDGRLAFVHAVFPVSLASLGLTHLGVAGAEVGDKVEVTLDARLHTLPDGTQVAAF